MGQQDGMLVFRQAELLLQMAFVDPFVIEAVDPVMLCNQRIVARVPEAVIHAIQYPPQNLAPVAQQSLESVPELGGHYLRGVGGADRNNTVRVDQSPLDKGPPAVKLQRFRRP